MSLALLFVLTCALAGVATGAALFYREGSKMAMYEVERTDAVQPGEFTNALVIASGRARARAAVAHLLPQGAKVQASRVDVTGAGKPAQLLTAYFDENAPVDTGDVLSANYPYDDMVG